MLMVGSVPSGFRVTWSQVAEAQATRHMRPGAVSPAAVRLRYGADLSPSGAVGDRFKQTAQADRQILADASAAGAYFLVTDNVADFSAEDLAQEGISAVSPDLFLAHKLTLAAYALVIELDGGTPSGSSNDSSSVTRRHCTAASPSLRRSRWSFSWRTFPESASPTGPLVLWHPLPELRDGSVPAGGPCRRQLPQLSIPNHLTPRLGRSSSSHPKPLCFA